MGSAYSEAIRERAESHEGLFQAFLATTHGRGVYSEFLDTHRRLVPELVQELEGIAHGSNVSFQTLFAMSLEEEIGYFAHPRSSGRADHCSDYMLCSAEHCVNGHNEDGNLPDRLFFVASVRMGGVNFTVLNYVGDLPGGMGAFAFNSAGIAFSLNWVGPRTCATDGLGRNFVSRLLLEARSWEEAVAVIGKKHAAGHNYQLMDFENRRIANFEVAQDRYSCREVTAPFFHANQYQTLMEPGQELSNSSLHRLARARELPPPSGPEDVLRALGDQHDAAFPIFHDAGSHDRGDLSDWTLATVLFDLDRRTVALMEGNPSRLEVRRLFGVPRSSPVGLLV